MVTEAGTHVRKHAAQAVLGSTKTTWPRWVAAIASFASPSGFPSFAAPINQGISQDKDLF